MSLRKSPERTLALLAALRRNAQNFTRPETPRGKADSSLNAFKHGRFARRSPQKLRVAGAGGVAGLFERFGQQILPTYRPESALEAMRHNRRRNETGMSFGMSTVSLAESCAEKKMLKMRFKATMLLKTNTNAFGTKPFFRFKAKSCGGSCNRYAVENK